jgi:hypothetical protein
MIRRAELIGTTVGSTIDGCVSQAKRHIDQVLARQLLLEIAYPPGDLVPAVVGGVVPVTVPPVKTNDFAYWVEIGTGRGQRVWVAAADALPVGGGGPP